MVADFPDFLKILSREADLVERFVRLLEQEKNLLTEGRADALVATIGEKESLAASLNDLARQRGRHLLDDGLPSGREGMASWAARNPRQKEAIAAWERTLSLAAQAKELNRTNGQLIQLHMQYTGEALEILRRKEDRLDLYGPDGRPATSEGQRIDDAV